MESAEELHRAWNPFGLRSVLRRVWLPRAAWHLMIGARIGVKRLRRGMDIASYMHRHDLRCLQIGAGPTSIAGWLRTDIELRHRGAVYLDATKPFPIPDASFDYVMSEHMIEHVSYEQGMAMLRECHRILKPGGRVRIATPDLARLLRLYGRENTGIERQYLDCIAQGHLQNAALAQPVFIINSLFRGWGHQFLYDEEILRDSLTAAGFIGIERFEPGESRTVPLQGIDRHTILGDAALNRFESVVLEARRP